MVIKMQKTNNLIQNQQLVQNILILIKTEGIIAGVRRLISSGNLFLNAISQKVTIIDKYDITGISTFDLLHNNESGTYFLDKNNNFTNVVEKVLIGNNYDISIRPVQTTDNTSYGQKTILRLKHANSDFSFGYKDAVVNNPSPVVLSHGMHSDLSTWDSFGEQLAESGRDTWQIEMYGGPTTECDTCGNYTFDDLKTDYWPALMMGVQEYSGQNDLSYVGYDLGCTVGLEALELFQEKGGSNVGYYFDYNTGQYVIQDLTTHPVGTFVGVACLGNFTRSNYYPEKELPVFPEYIRTTGVFDNKSIIDQGFHGHIPSSFYKGKDFLPSLLEPKVTTYILADVAFQILIAAFDISVPPATINALSTSTYKDIQSWINGSVDPKVGKINITNFAIIQSAYEPNNPYENIGMITYNVGTDNFVSVDDQKYICKNVNATSSKYYVGFKNIPHFGSTFVWGISEKPKVLDLINNLLNDNFIVEEDPPYEILSNQEDCE